MLELNLVTVLSLVVLLIYCFQAVYFAGQILSHKKINIWLNLTLAIINFALLTTVFYFNIPFYLMYIIIFVGVLIEIKLLSNTKTGQAVFGGLVFMLNISPVHFLTIILLSHFTNTNIGHYFTNVTLKAQGILIAFTILSLILIVFKNFIPLQAVINLSKTFPYSAVISLTAITMFINTLSDSYFLVASYEYTSSVITTICDILFGYVVFYFVFLFSLSLINMHEYKRKSDEVEKTYNQVMIEKVKVNTKIYTDELTGLYNRKYLDEKIDLLLQDDTAEFVSFFVDLTGLKHVNDTFGHENGDKYIKIVAKILKNSMRSCDTVARVGGDEFIVIAEDLNEDKIDTVLSRIRKIIKNENEKQSFLVNASIGSVYVNNQKNKYEKSQIFDKADELMRADKKLFYSEMENKK